MECSNRRAARERGLGEPEVGQTVDDLIAFESLLTLELGRADLNQLAGALEIQLKRGNPL